MLRLRPARALPPAVLHSQRLIWSRASGFMAWLGLGPNSAPDNPADPRQPQQQPPPAVSLTPSQPPPNRLVEKRVLRLRPPAGAVFPTLKIPPWPKKGEHAASTLGRFSWKIKNAPTSKELLDAWQVISQCQPFVMDTEGPLRVRMAVVEDVGDKRPWIMQMVPADVFVQLSADIRSRTLFVGSTGAELDADVVVANEALVVGNLIKAFHTMNEHKLVVAFFEAYDRDRSVWLREHQFREAAKVPDNNLDDCKTECRTEPGTREKPKRIEKATQLSRTVYSCYLRSLAALKQSTKTVRLFEDDDHLLERTCGTVPNLYLLLHACRNENNGELARQAIETITQCSPAAVVPLGCYELAIRSILRTRKRNERELVSAIHLAKVLHSDGGFILKPDIWCSLIKVSLKMGRPDLALEVFKSYPRHCIPESQSSFRQALRAACSLTDSTALDMMHFCWASDNNEYPNAKTVLDERKTYQDVKYFNNSDTRGLSVGCVALATSFSALNKETETELLNMMLWEMLKHRHAVPSLMQVVDLMETTRSKCGAVALRRTVLAMFEDDMKQKNMSPLAAVENSLKFWGEHSSVLNGQGFIVHLLLEECVEHHWDNECEYMVDYLLEVGVTRVPTKTIVKMMGTNEVRGRFEANTRIGEKLLQKLSHKGRRNLRDEFYERFLMSYLRLEQFDKVSEQHAKCNLEKRYPHNEVIRAIVQDAIAAQ